MATLVQLLCCNDRRQGSYVTVIATKKLDKKQTKVGRAVEVSIDRPRIFIHGTGLTGLASKETPHAGLETGAPSEK
jgi:hypothetical protein